VVAELQNEIAKKKKNREEQSRDSKRLVGGGGGGGGGALVWFRVFSCKVIVFGSNNE